MNEGMVCRNIGRGQRRLRYVSAIFAATIALILYAVLVMANVQRGWRLILIIPLAIATSAYSEASHGVCIVLASREEESLEETIKVSRAVHGDKMAQIETPGFREALRAQAQVVQRQSLLLAVALTAILFLIL